MSFLKKIIVVFVYFAAILHGPGERVLCFGRDGHVSFAPHHHNCSGRTVEFQQKPGHFNFAARHPGPGHCLDIDVPSMGNHAKSGEKELLLSTTAVAASYYPVRIPAATDFLKDIRPNAPPNLGKSYVHKILEKSIILN